MTTTNKLLDRVRPLAQRPATKTETAIIALKMVPMAKPGKRTANNSSTTTARNVPGGA